MRVRVCVCVCVCVHACMRVCVRVCAPIPTHVGTDIGTTFLGLTCTIVDLDGINLRNHKLQMEIKGFQDDLLVL